MVLEWIPGGHPVQLTPIHFGSAPLLPVVSGQKYTILVVVCNNTCKEFFNLLLLFYNQIFSRSVSFYFSSSWLMCRFNTSGLHQYCPCNVNFPGCVLRCHIVVWLLWFPHYSVCHTYAITQQGSGDRFYVGFMTMMCGSERYVAIQFVFCTFNCDHPAIHVLYMLCHDTFD